MNFLNHIYLGNSLQSWLIAIGVICGSVIVGKATYLFFKQKVSKWAAHTETKLDDIIVDMLEEPFAACIIILGTWIATGQLSFPENVSSFLERGFHIALILLVAWLCVRLLDALIAEYIVPLVEDSESDLDDQLLPLVRRCLKTVIWVIAIIISAQHAGYNVGALIAGLGVGGLAFALAAQDAVSNLFGGFTIFTDQPFKLNDRIQVKGFDGVVKDIGMRSTRLQNANGRTLIMPNSTFTGATIENVSSESNRKNAVELGLSYDTDADGIETAMRILRDINQETEGTEENCVVGFNSFGDSALGLLFVYYITKDADILGVQTTVNLKILRRFAAAGLEFPFPTQTLHIKQDPVFERETRSVTTAMG